MLRVSEKKTEEVAEQKRKRDKARLMCKRGRHEAYYEMNTELAAQYHSGQLQREKEEAETIYGDRKQKGIAEYLGPRMGN